MNPEKSIAGSGSCDTEGSEDHVTLETKVTVDENVGLHYIF